MNDDTNTDERPADGAERIDDGPPREVAVEVGEVEQVRREIGGRRVLLQVDPRLLESFEVGERSFQRALRAHPNRNFDGADPAPSSRAPRAGGTKVRVRSAAPGSIAPTR